MPRALRLDEPGDWHHVMNRGVAPLAVFEARQEVRQFLCAVARQVRAGRLEVHAYSLLPAEYHLLVRSPKGELSEAIRRVTNTYVRWFNQHRNREGPLFRSRFRSKRIRTRAYRDAVHAYIDNLAVEAGLATSPWEYAHGSASRHVEDRGPRWLSRDWIDERLARIAPGLPPRQGYAELLRQRTRVGLSEWIEGRLFSRFDHDELDDLIEAAPPRLTHWLRQKSPAGGRKRNGLSLVLEAQVLWAIEGRARRDGTWTARRSGREVDLWQVLRVGLLHDVSSQTWAEMSRALRRPSSSNRCSYATYRVLLESDVRFARVAGELTGEAIRAMHGTANGRDGFIAPAPRGRLHDHHPACRQGPSPEEDPTSLPGEGESSGECRVLPF